MDEKHQNRKKDKYNPYTLIILDGRYYLSFKDSRGALQSIEIDEVQMCIRDREYTVQNPNSIKVIPFILNEEAPILIISTFPVVNCETIVAENRLNNKPTITQKMVDHKTEVLIAVRRRSNFFAP